MTEQIDEVNEPDITLGVEFYPKPSADGESETLELRQVVLGHGMAVLINFVDTSTDDRESVAIEVAASGMDREMLVELFEDLAETIKGLSDEEKVGND